MRVLSTLLLALFISIGVFASGYEDMAGPAGQDPFLKEFSVYPNPSAGLLTISLEAFDNDQSLTLKVYSVIGQEMQSQRIAPFRGSKSLKMDLTKLPRGVYMVEVSNGKQSNSKRVLLR